MGTRGFTLLELVSATAIAGLILSVCLGLFSAAETSDARMQARFDHAAALASTRAIVARSMDTLLTSGEPQAGAAANAPRRGEPPPRVILEPDPPALRSARSAGLAAGTPPQRLELVLSARPVPAGFNPAARPGTLRERARALREPPGTGPGGATRCAFELRPDAFTPGLEVRDGSGAGWTLWWRPLPAPEHRGGPPTDPASDPDAIPLISGLTTCRWTVFVNRERRQELSATRWIDLPAYMELEVATTSGLTGNWVFEVGWRSGPETEEQAAESPGEPPGRPARTEERRGR